MKKYSVALEEVEIHRDGLVDVAAWVFECMADDYGHAEEQARNAYPEAYVAYIMDIME